MTGSTHYSFSTRKFAACIVAGLLLMSSQIYGSGENTLPPPPQGAFIHAVYFWLNEGVTVEQKDTFEEILRSLKEIKSVKKIFIGRPAGTPRTVVDNTYDVALIVHFRDKAGHDAYQTDHLHTSAVGKFEAWIKTVKIYDTIVE